MHLSSGHARATCSAYAQRQQVHVAIMRCQDRGTSADVHSAIDIVGAIETGPTACQQPTPPALQKSEGEGLLSSQQCKSRFELQLES